MLRQFEFTVTIKAADILEAKEIAKNLFNEKIFEEEVSWEQVYKRKKEIIPDIEPIREGKEL